MHVVHRAKWRTAAAVTAVLALVLTFLVTMTGPAQATSPGAEGKIAFMRYGDPLPSGYSATEIWTVNPDGSELVNLTPGGSTLQPEWSPRGTRIAYFEFVNNIVQLIVMNADGSNKRQVSNVSSCCLNFPTWSADERTIAFIYDGSIVGIDVETGVTRTLVGSEPGVHYTEASFSPDGKYLAWTETKYSVVDNVPVPDVQLLRSNADGSERVVLRAYDSTNDHINANYIQWYPDSSKIGWGYTRSTGSGTFSRQHAVTDVQGVVLSDVSNNNVSEVIPSPTGERLLVRALAGGFFKYHFATLDLEITGEAPLGFIHSVYVRSWQAVNTTPPSDTAAPTVTISSPLQGSEVVVGASLTADYSCIDEVGGSGLASCAGDVADGASLDTSIVGNKTFTVTARDSAGNETAKTVNYRVVWPFGNFTGPVDPLPTLNSGKAGGVVPVKFSLGGDRGLNILAAGYPKSSQITCDSTAPVDAIETSTLSPGNNVLTYDSATDQYGYNWKTDKTWKGTCRQLTFMLADGATYKANFKFS